MYCAMYALKELLSVFLHLVLLISIQLKTHLVNTLFQILPFFIRLGLYALIKLIISFGIHFKKARIIFKNYFALPTLFIYFIPFEKT